MPRKSFCIFSEDRRSVLKSCSSLLHYHQHQLYHHYQAQTSAPHRHFHRHQYFNQWTALSGAAPSYLSYETTTTKPFPDALHVEAAQTEFEHTVAQGGHHAAGAGVAAISAKHRCQQTQQHVSTSDGSTMCDTVILPPAACGVPDRHGKTGGEPRR